MKTIKKSVSAEITEKKSKFICNLFYVETAKEAKEKLEIVRKKYHDAKHNCFAYRVIEEERIIERASDDGEPSGTAGAPILQLLSKGELVNVLTVVTRYFGGILLGTGGLVRAYSQATSDAINKSEITNLEYGELLKIPVSYQNIEYIKYYCNKNNINIVKIGFEEEPYIIIEATIDEKHKILSEIEKKQFNIQKIEFIEKRYISKNF